MDHTQIDFNGLVLGFSASALLYLGQGSESQPNKPKPNLDLAKHNIQIIELLKEKTDGNLTDEEVRLLSDVLKDLRLKYADAIASSEAKP